MEAVRKRWRLVVTGVSGSGKSEIGRRLAARLGIDYVEGDDYHPPHNVAKMSAGTPLDDADRQDWLCALRDILHKAVEEQRGIVLSCSALKRRYRDLLRQGDPAAIFIYLHGERELIAQRMRTRAGHFMPLSLLDSQFRALEPPAADEKGMAVDIRLAPDRLVNHIVQRLAAMP